MHIVSTCNVLFKIDFNQFFQFKIAKSMLVPNGSNNLIVGFESPVIYAEKAFERQAKNHYMVPRECVPDQFNGECHVNHIRKMQASFAWDWGPAFPSVGVWQPISLVRFSAAAIAHVKWSASENPIDRVWVVDLNVVFDVAHEKVIEGLLTVELEGFDAVMGRVKVKHLDSGEAVSSTTLTFPSEKVKLWWPNELGNQTLYELKVRFETGSDVTEARKRVGFRNITRVEESEGLPRGASFNFHVNGVPIFAKGSNWIPAHVLPEQATEEMVYDLMLSAKEAHMNMLRVWGGGIYESDYLYSLADEMGILIWQDFMFACNLYPANDEDIERASAEVKHQVRHE